MPNDPRDPAVPGAERRLRDEAEADREHTTPAHPPPGPPGGAPIIGPGPEPRRERGADLDRQADAGVPDAPERG